VDVGRAAAARVRSAAEATRAKVRAAVHFTHAIAEALSFLIASATSSPSNVPHASHATGMKQAAINQ